MARTNQGIFKEIRKEYDELHNCYISIEKEYFDDEVWNCNKDFVTDFAFVADDIYKDANRLSSKIATMLKCTKFEDEKIMCEFMEMSNDCKKIKQEIKCKFDEVLTQILYGSYFSESEKNTLNSMAIYNS